MAPINPVEILCAFAPLLTTKGGIKPVEDKTQFQKIYDIMKNCSTKLVSKCIYYQILMATSPDVMEHFLTIGGWDLICLWTKSSRDIGNVTFLLDLLKLLQTLPMNIDRLRENECPKIVKKLCKHENKDIAILAKQIIKKWTKIIQSLSSNSNDNNNSTSATTNSMSSPSSDKNKDKKRKSSDTTVNLNKKSKTIDTDTLNSNNEISKISEDSLDKCSESTKTVTILQPVKRPSTVKVKQGKFRLDLTSTSNSSNNNDRIKKNKKLNDQNNDQNVMRAKSILKDRMLNKANTVTGMMGNGVGSPNSNRTILKDSISFMDAISMVPLSNVVKKRRKMVSNLNSNSMNNNSDNIKQDSFMMNDKSLTNNLNYSDDLSSSSSSSLATTTLNQDESLKKNDNNKGSCAVVAAAAFDDRDKNVDSNNVELSNNNNSKDLVEDNRAKTATENQSVVTPRFSFYKDTILDEQCDNNDNDAKSNTVDDVGKKDDDDNGKGFKSNNDDDDNGNKSDSDIENNNKTNVVTNTDSNDDNEFNKKEETVVSRAKNNCDNHGGDNQNEIVNTANKSKSLPMKPKPILCYVRKNSSKRVRWPDNDNDLEKVKYFELDENERINVTRPSADMKRFDMKHEAQMMNVAKRCTIYAPWQLIPIDIDQSNLLVERGKDSRERIIQTERMKTTLECFFIFNQLPDSADEPDHTAYDIMSDLSSQDMKPKIIPLEDENAIASERAGYIQDYSSTSVMQQQQPAPTMIDPNNFNVPAEVQPFNMAGMPMVADKVDTNYSSINTNEQNYLPPISQSLPMTFNQAQSNFSTGSLPFMPNNLPSNNFNDNQMAPPPPPQSLPQQPFDQPTPSNNFHNDFSSIYHQPPHPVFNSNPPSQFPTILPQPNNENFISGPPPPPHQAFPNNNPNFAPPPQSSIQSNDNYWSEPNVSAANMNNNNNNTLNSNLNFPPGPPPVQQPPFQQGPGPRPFRPRGSSGGNGHQRGPRFFSRNNNNGGGGGGGNNNNNNNNNNDVCRFFFKTGKCKFENRCNFSHVLDQQKSQIRF